MYNALCWRATSDYIVGLCVFCMDEMGVGLFASGECIESLNCGEVQSFRLAEKISPNIVKYKLYTWLSGAL